MNFPGSIIKQAGCWYKSTFGASAGMGGEPNNRMPEEKDNVKWTPPGWCKTKLLISGQKYILI